MSCTSSVYKMVYMCVERTHDDDDDTGDNGGGQQTQKIKKYGLKRENGKERKKENSNEKAEKDVNVK